MKLENGRPKTNNDRLEKEIRVYDFLDALHISYCRVDHDAAMTMDACEEIDKFLGTKMCKNLFLCNRQQTVFYLLMLPGDKPFKTSILSKQIGSSRLSFAGHDSMEIFLDITPGSLSVLGLMNDRENHVNLLIDEELLLNEAIGCHPCINTSSLKILTKDLLEIYLPAVHHGFQVVSLPRDMG